MALNSVSSLSIKSLYVSSTSRSRSKPFSPVCQINSNTDCKKWGKLVAAAVTTFGPALTVLADLNKFEAEMRGEFGIGSAAQFGSADLSFVS
ncbi:hypothetical protein K1719_027689 [Acacia pycnantha]|nr:hypothetical protein K1719_027689 [Acacia pycnantha]